MTASDDLRVPVAPSLELAVRAVPGGTPPFVLVHGLASNARMWDGVAAALAPAASYAVDLRGHGRSDKPDSGYGVPDVAADVLLVLEKLHLRDAVLVGQSWGAAVVMQAAAADPSAIAGVVCVDGALGRLADRYPRFDDCWAELAPPPLAGTPYDALAARLRAMHPDWPETGLLGTLACFERRADGTAAPWLTMARHREVLRGLWEWDPGAVLPKVDRPVLLIPARPPGADEGALSSPASVELSLSLLRHGRAQWLTGDHDLHAQHPAEVAALLTDFAGGPQ